jgi:hypothetical protein
MNYAQVQVSQAVLDLMDKIAAVVSAAKGGASAALEAAVADLVPVVQDVQALPGDISADEPAVVKAALCGAVDIVKAARS